jgi:predicted small lipoprotein YifL
LDSSFKFTIFLFFFFLAGCGVKSDPLPPEGTGLPSIIDSHLAKEEVIEEKKKDDQQAQATQDKESKQ